MKKKGIAGKIGFLVFLLLMLGIAAVLLGALAIYALAVNYFPD